MAGVYTVTQINSYIKNMFKQDFVLKSIQIKGEISNCKYHTSGHIYFTLKDELGTINSIMFAGNARKLQFRLEDGLKVVIAGYVDVYERDGKYQLYAESVKEEGIGDLTKKFNELKQMYEEMGYFSNIYKKPIPTFSKKIGVVTASTGAAIRDIINISHRRNPYVELILYPALVQGDNAKYSIAKGIQVLDRAGLDCIIVGRGGGSIEDLWAFNEPDVIEAIFNANTPIISAVGHEIDFTIADYVADRRAETPSAAAELAVFDILIVENTINTYYKRMNISMKNELRKYKDIIQKFEMKLQYLNPVNVTNKTRQDLIKLEEKLYNAMQSLMVEYKNKVSLYAAKMDGLSPLKKLTTGYSFVENNGKNVTSIEDVSINDKLDIYVKDGVIKAIVGGKYGQERK